MWAFGQTTLPCTVGFAVKSHDVPEIQGDDPVAPPPPNVVWHEYTYPARGLVDSLPSPSGSAVSDGAPAPVLVVVLLVAVVGATDCAPQASTVMTASAGGKAMRQRGIRGM
jgi:hypothetical protein